MLSQYIFGRVIRFEKLSALDTTYITSYLIMTRNNYQVYGTLLYYKK